ncbi:hypothetical protein [Glycomyces buryatensis]|uniref:Uncharacterized protein n=1 Tax=Glycomyces buryatensis TaxID=2570927 RepID=A0A4V4HSW9_9ACTN|nr:hypothetical protein [Glycomyces buryatensis]THV42716.1 hypothetical protein FAB82_04845 [Glycomyces buryatensis]
MNEIQDLNAPQNPAADAERAVRAAAVQAAVSLSGGSEGPPMPRTFFRRVEIIEAYIRDGSKPEKDVMMKDW